jgi:peptidylprolyl isomerase/peptidyl-prolyl cis-trans isomerase B (cyclophilin B)
MKSKRRPVRMWMAAALSLALTLPACGETQKAEETPEPVEATRPAENADVREAPKPPEEKRSMAIITMEKGGAIELEFYPEVAPKTVENFITLAKKRFYDGLTFHRVEPGFVVQGGDPNGNGTGGPGYTLKAEFSSKPHERGTVAMARSSHPDSAGSQFYICLGDAPHLNGKYTVFGKVSKGMEVVDQIRVGDRMKSVQVEE